MNKKKLVAFGVISSVLTMTMVAFQNFTVNVGTSENEPTRSPSSSSSLTDAISAALKSAEADTAAKQIALNVEPQQIEKASLRKKRTPNVIMGSDEALNEVNPHWAPKEDMAEESDVEDNIGSELEDKP